MLVHELRLYLWVDLRIGADSADELHLRRLKRIILLEEGMESVCRKLVSQILALED